MYSIFRPALSMSKRLLLNDPSHGVPQGKNDKALWPLLRIWNFASHCWPTEIVASISIDRVRDIFWCATVTDSVRACACARPQEDNKATAARPLRCLIIRFKKPPLLTEMNKPILPHAGKVVTVSFSGTTPAEHLSDYHINIKVLRFHTTKPNQSS